MNITQWSLHSISHNESNLKNIRNIYFNRYIIITLNLFCIYVNIFHYCGTDTVPGAATIPGADSANGADSADGAGSAIFFKNINKYTREVYQ